MARTTRLCPPPVRSGYPSTGPRANAVHQTPPPLYVSWRQGRPGDSGLPGRLQVRCTGRCVLNTGQRRGVHRRAGGVGACADVAQELGGLGLRGGGRGIIADELVPDARARDVVQPGSVVPAWVELQPAVGDCVGGGGGGGGGEEDQRTGVGGLERIGVAATVGGTCECAVALVAVLGGRTARCSTRPSSSVSMPAAT